MQDSLLRGKTQSRSFSRSGIRIIVSWIFFRSVIFSLCTKSVCFIFGSSSTVFSVWFSRTSVSIFRIYILVIRRSHFFFIINDFFSCSFDKLILIFSFFNSFLYFIFDFFRDSSSIFRRKNNLKVFFSAATNVR